MNSVICCAMTMALAGILGTAPELQAAGAPRGGRDAGPTRTGPSAFASKAHVRGGGAYGVWRDDLVRPRLTCDLSAVDVAAFDPLPSAANVGIVATKLGDADELGWHRNAGTAPHLMPTFDFRPSADDGTPEAYCSAPRAKVPGAVSLPGEPFSAAIDAAHVRASDLLSHCATSLNTHHWSTTPLVDNGSACPDPPAFSRHCPRRCAVPEASPATLTCLAALVLWRRRQVRPWGETVPRIACILDRRRPQSLATSGRVL
jgi:hypothetical protein